MKGVCVWWGGSLSLVFIYCGLERSLDDLRMMSPHLVFGFLELKQ